MIYDQCCVWRRYVPKRAELFCQAMEFLRTFTPETAPGKHVLIDGKIFANVQEYTPKALADGVVEYHREFVDLQTLLVGEEIICYCPVDALTETRPYDEAGDYGLYALEPAKATRLSLKPGNFAIFFTEEGHAPCLSAATAPAPVKKVVLKLHKSIFL